MRADHTLSLLTLKPGLSPAQDARTPSQVWFGRDLGVSTHGVEHPADAELLAMTRCTLRRAMPMAHKGSQGSVRVVGGAAGGGCRTPGAPGAALAAGRPRLPGRAVRCPGPADPALAQLMRAGAEPAVVAQPGVVTLAGCGAAAPSLRTCRTCFSAKAARLVLDADAPERRGRFSRLGQALQARTLPTVLAHPLEAARLLGCTVLEVPSRPPARQPRSSSPEPGCSVVPERLGQRDRIARPHRERLGAAAQPWPVPVPR